MVWLHKLSATAPFVEIWLFVIILGQFFKKSIYINLVASYAKLLCVWFSNLFQLVVKQHLVFQIILI